MARPRTNRSPAQTDGIGAANIDHQALVEAGSSATEHAQQLSVIDMQYALDGEAYSLPRIRAMMPIALEMTRMGILWLGRALILVREHETKDAYGAFLDEFAISSHTAREYMRAAIAIRERPQLETLGASKVLALASEPDEKLDALIDGGTLAGHTLDEIDSMTTRELKDALRAERKEREEEKAADEEIIRGKDERINKLMRSKRKLETSSVREQVDDLLRDMDECAVALAQQATQLSRGINDVRRAYEEAGEQPEPEVEARISQNVELGAQWLRELAALDGE
jgi:hypothetical protein